MIPICKNLIHDIFSKTVKIFNRENFQFYGTHTKLI